MKHITPVLLLVALVSVHAGAQPPAPRCGDLVVAVGGTNGGYTAFLSPTNPGTLTILSSAPWIPGGNSWVRMDSNNSDLMVCEMDRTTNPYSGTFLRIGPGGQRTTISSLGTVMSDGFELDHDGWIACARIVPTNPTRINRLLHVVPGSLTTLTTCWSLPMTVYFNEMAIDRDPGASAPYVLATCCCSVSSIYPLILRADRKGTLTTILTTLTSSCRDFRCVEVDPRSGDFLLIESNLGLVRMDKTCTRQKTLMPGLIASALKIGQDDHVWIAANKPERILKYNLSSNTVVATYPTGLPPSGQALQGIDFYGSRPLVCNQIAPARVTVNVQSRNPMAGAQGTGYALAVSLARRPGVRFPHGQWLDLDVTNPLFLMSALNMFPRTILNGFTGKLSVQGNATASVSIPAALVGSGVPVFVAGVIFNAAGVFEVTNTHWFVM